MRTKSQTLINILTEAKQPVPRDELARILNVSDRTVRRTIHDLRLMGIPICSNSQQKGYTIATGHELKHMVADLRARGNECLKVAKKIQKGAENMTCNPISDAEKYTEETENIDDFPVCDICGEHMTEGVELADGTRVCDNCFSFKTFDPEVA